GGKTRADWTKIGECENMKGEVRTHWRMAALLVVVGLGMGVAVPTDAQNVESGAKSRGGASSTAGGDARARHGPRRQTATIGGRDVVLVLDPDQCLLDRNHPSDSRVYELVE